MKKNIKKQFNSLKSKIFIGLAVLIFGFFGVQYLSVPGQLTGSLQVGRHEVSFPDSFSNSDNEIDLTINLVGKVPDKFQLKFTNFYPSQEMQILPVQDSSSNARGIRSESNLRKYKIVNFDPTEIDDAIKFQIISNSSSFFPKQLVKIPKGKSKPLLSRFNLKPDTSSPILSNSASGKDNDITIPSDYDVNIKFSLLQDDRSFLEFHNANSNLEEVAARFSWDLYSDGYRISVTDNISPNDARVYTWTQVGDSVQIVTDAKTYYVVLEHIREIDSAPLFSLYSRGDAYIKIPKDNQYWIEFWDENHLYFGRPDFSHNTYVLKGFNSDEDLLEFSRFRSFGFSTENLNDYLLQDSQGYLHMRTHGGYQTNDTQDYLIKSFGSESDNLNVALRSVDPLSYTVKVALRFARLDNPSLLGAPNRINFITRVYRFNDVCGLYLDSVDNETVNIKGSFSGCVIDRDGVNIALGERAQIISGTDDIFMTVEAVTDNFVDVIVERVGSNYLDIVQETVYEDVIYTFSGEGSELGAELAPASFDSSYVYVKDSNFNQEFIKLNAGDEFTLNPINHSFLYDVIRMEDKLVGNRVNNVYRFRNTDFEQEFYRNEPTVSFERNTNAYLAGESTELGTLQISGSTPLSHLRVLNFELNGCYYGVESLEFIRLNANGEPLFSAGEIMSDTSNFEFVINNYNTSETFYKVILNQNMDYEETKDYCLQSPLSSISDLGMVIESLIYSNNEESEDLIEIDLDLWRQVYYGSEIL